MARFFKKIETELEGFFYGTLINGHFMVLLAELGQGVRLLLRCFLYQVRVVGFLISGELQVEITCSLNRGSETAFSYSDRLSHSK